MNELQHKACQLGGPHAPKQSMALAAEIDFGRIQHGVWHSGPGELDIQFAWNETILIIDGSAEVENRDTGEKFVLSKGSMMSFERGSHWLWRIPWKLSKVFTVVE